MKFKTKKIKHFWGTEQISGTNDWRFLATIFKTPIDTTWVKFYPLRIPLFFKEKHM